VVVLGEHEISGRDVILISIVRVKRACAFGLCVCEIQCNLENNRYFYDVL